MLEENIPAEYEVLSFLVKAWSRNNQAKLVQLEGEELSYKGRFSPFRSQPPATVYIGKYRDASIMPGAKGLRRWRLFRYLTFHEALHLLYTKPGRIGDPVTEAVFNILEDCRIEKLGIREYRGYLGEKLHATAYGYLQRPKVRGLHTREEFLEALLQLSYAGRVKGRLVPWDRRYRALREYASRARALETFEEAVALAKEVSTYLQEEYGSAKAMEWNWHWINSERKDEFHGSEILKVAEALAGRKIPRSTATSTPSIKREYEKIRSHEEPEKAGEREKKRVRVMTPEGKKDYWSLMEGTQVLQRVMKSRLQRWRIGWEEKLDEVGDEIDVEELIAGKMRDRRVFYDEEKLTSRSKILILLDLSTSVSSRLQKYKQATGVICEVLSSLGARFAVYGYYRDESDNESILLEVKDINQGWGELSRRRLASLQASGSTPTGTVLLTARRYMARNDIRRLVLITDGLPEPADLEVPLTLRAVRELRKSSRVYLLGIADFSTLRAMRHSMERFRPDRCEVIFDLNQLPKVFFRLLKERG